MVKIEKLIHQAIYGSSRKKTYKKRTYKKHVPKVSPIEKTTDSLKSLEEENKELAKENEELSTRLDEIADRITSILKDSISPEIVCVEIEGCESKDSVNELYSSARTLFSKMNISFTKGQIARIEKKRAELESKSFSINGNYIEHQTNNY